MPHKRGPKTEVPGLVLKRRAFMVDETADRMLNALASLDPKPNASRTLRRLIREAYARFQKE